MKLTSEELVQFGTEDRLFRPSCFSAREAGVLRRAADQIYTMNRRKVSVLHEPAPLPPRETKWN